MALGSGLSHLEEPPGQSSLPSLYLLLWAFPWPRVSTDPSRGSHAHVCVLSLVAHLGASAFSPLCTGLHSQVPRGPARVCPSPWHTRSPGSTASSAHRSPEPVRRGAHPSSSHLLCIPPRGHCGFPGPLSPVPLVSSGHTCVRGSPLRKYHAPTPMTLGH